VEFESLLAEGQSVDVEAFWGAGFLQGRYRPGAISWTWPEVVRPLLTRATRLLDMGTGEGGVLAGLAPLPPVTVAYEEWPPTIPAARDTLRPLRVHLVQTRGSLENAGRPGIDDRPALPFAASAFDVVLSRHEAFDPADVARITRAGGVFLTQQVGSDEAASVRSLFDLPIDAPVWDARVAVSQLESAGWRIADVREERTLSEFTDIGALIAYVRSLPWAYPDLDVHRALPRLRRLHDQSRVRPIPAVSHRFLVRAHR
jgi:SAM-dependent methyltransferase